MRPWLGAFSVDIVSRVRAPPRASSGARGVLFVTVVLASGGGAGVLLGSARDAYARARPSQRTRGTRARLAGTVRTAVASRVRLASPVRWTPLAGARRARAERQRVVCVSNALVFNIFSSITHKTYRKMTSNVKYTEGSRKSKQTRVAAPAGPRAARVHTPPFVRRGRSQAACRPPTRRARATGQRRRPPASLLTAAAQTPRSARASRRRARRTWCPRGTHT